MTDMKRCMRCMNTYDGEFRICPHCGYDEDTPPKVEYHLHPGVEIGQRYTIGITLGYGGFGITYKAWDKKLERIVAIKEFFPAHLVSRIPGTEKVNIQGQSKVDLYYKEKEKFLQEAKTLAKFNSHPNIVHVSDFFEMNKTAYMVMEYLDGIDLLQHVKRMQEQRISSEEMIPLILEVCKALDSIHKSGIVHRDIAPDNIKITTDGRVKLLDFGAAKESSGDAAGEFTVVVKPGYAPPEQYMKKSKIGPWTDIYALCATMYRLLTGIKPVEASDRSAEECLKLPREINPQIPAWLEQVILRGMALEPKNRFKNIKQLADALSQEKEVAAPEVVQRRRSYHRIIAFVAAIAVCTAGILFVVPGKNTLTDRGIDDGEIAVTLPDTQYCRQAYTMAKEGFEKAFPGKTVSLDYIDEKKYTEEMNRGFGDANVIYAGGLDDAVQEEAAQIDDILGKLETDAYYGLASNDGELGYSKTTPVSMDIYVLVYNKYLVKRNSELNKLISDNNELGLSLETLGENILTDKKQFQSEFELPGISKTESAAKHFCDNKCAMVLTSTDRLAEIQNEMAGYYEILYTSDLSGGVFSNYFLIKDDVSENEKKIAELWLRYLLSDEGQSILFIRNTGSLPLKKSVFDEYLAIHKDWSVLEEQLAHVDITID